MKVLVYSAKSFEISLLEAANDGKHEITFIRERLTSESAIRAVGYPVISIFSADDASPNTLEKLKDFGVRYLSLRSTGHDNLNRPKARKLGFKVANASGYSPHAVAEHAIALLLALNRKILPANAQMEQSNFSLDHLVGFNLFEKTVGIMGTGRIGSVLVKIMAGFGCEILANDNSIKPELQKSYGVEYISKDALAREADVIIIALPLTSETHHLVDEVFLRKVKMHSIIVNVARGAIVDTKAMLTALDRGELAGYATDVYEKEDGVFFYDHSDSGGIDDPQLVALIQHPKTLLTPHQAFVTNEALEHIAKTTIHNIDCWENGRIPMNELC